MIYIYVCVYIFMYIKVILTPIALDAHKSKVQNHWLQVQTVQIHKPQARIAIHPTGTTPETLHLQSGVGIA